MQTRGKEFESHISDLGCVRIANDPHLAFADRDGEPSICQPVHTADFQRDALAGLPFGAARSCWRVGREDVRDGISRVRSLGSGGNESREEDEGFHFHE